MLNAACVAALWSFCTLAAMLVVAELVKVGIASHDWWLRLNSLVESLSIIMSINAVVLVALGIAVKYG